MATLGATLIVGALVLPETAGSAEDGTLPPAEAPTTTLVIDGGDEPTDELSGAVAEATDDVDDPTGLVKPSTTTSSSTTTTVPGASTSTSSTTTTAPPTDDTDDTDDTADADRGERPAEESGEPFKFPDLPEFHLPPAPVPVATLDPFAAFDPQFSYIPVPGRRSTQDIIDLLEPLDLTEQDIARVIAPFPVAGEAHYSDDWGAPRTNPYPHRHEGTDVFAQEGTPVIAVADGTVSQVAPDTAVGGNAVYLTVADGTYYYYAHLDGFAEGLRAGDEVEEGDVLGFVGNTGNAEGTQDHLHFEIHPDGGEATPPIPQLDAWLDAARAEAERLAGGAATPSAEGRVAPRLRPGVLPQSVPASISGPDRSDYAIWLVLFAAIGAVVARARVRRRAVPALVAAKSRGRVDAPTDPHRARWARPAMLPPKLVGRAQRFATRLTRRAADRVPWRSREPDVTRRQGFDLLGMEKTFVRPSDQSTAAQRSQGDDT